jgi:pilus assembly protein CpaE
MQDDKIRVLIVDDAADTRESIRKLLLYDKAIEVIGTIGTAKDAIQMATEKQPHVVLMDINMSDMDGIAATETMRKKVPFVQVIILSVQDDLNLMRRAMMAGARDFLTKPPDVDELVRAIHRSHDLAKEEINKMGTVGVTGVTPAGETIYGSAIFGKVIMVYSPKGGTGVTTVATNLAVTMNSQNTHVVLVDGSLQFGDVTVFLNEQPRSSIVDLAPRADELDPDIVNDVLINHSQTGLRILAACPRPEMADKITGQQFVKILGFLRRLYHFVIIDTSSYLSEPIIAAMDESDLIILLTTQDIPAIRDTKIYLNLVDSFNISKDKLLFVLNKSDKRIPITTEKVSEALKHDVKLEIVFDDRTVINSINRGQPFVLDPKPQPIVRNIMELADTIRSILFSENKTENEIKG